MKHARQNRLIFPQFRRGGASSRVTKRTLVGLAPEYVQKRRKSSLFCGYAPNFFQSSKSAPVVVRRRFKKPAPRHYTRNGVACQVFFARMLQIFPNQGSLRNGVVNLRKFGQNPRKVLDIPTPRAAPRNSLTFFSRMAAKSFDNGCLW